jgi:MerR family mercuric resistance operon transcriptional regulator
LTHVLGTWFIIDRCDNNEYLISEFAEKSRVNKETIRYYEQKKLLKEPSRTESGYRLHSDEDIRRVKYIKQMQDLG